MFVAKIPYREGTTPIRLESLRPRFLLGRHAGWDIDLISVMAFDNRH
jgi:hypothetical protein